MKMEFNETKSQERLINLMLQAGVEWPSPVCTHAAQDADGEVWTYFSKPLYINGDWSSSIGANSCICSLEKLPNYHQTIITREQYEAREGWITWHGGECPVDRETLVEVRLKDIESNYGKLRATAFSWSHKGFVDDIIAYRIHKERPAFKPCEPAKACIPDQPTIEQLIQQWKQKDCALETEERKLKEQQAALDAAKRDADEAKKAVDDALLAAGYYVGGAV